MKTLAIITPTYNRANLLHIAYQSLEKQTVKDFVWYIIDDGSSDNTEQVISEFVDKSSFKIVYHKKPNGGKHSALNVAYSLLNEELSLILDSDDGLTENAVETILNDYTSIKDDKTICGLGYLRLDKKSNQTIGVQYTADGIIDTFTNQRINKNTWGDKCEVFKTNILKQYPFPEFEGENFVSESVVWCKMSPDYKMKFRNIGIYICDYQTGGLSDGVHKRLFNNPKGASACYLSMSSKQVKLKYRLKYTIAYIVYSLAAKIKLKQQFKQISSKFIYMLTFIPSWFIYLRKKRGYKK